MTKPCKGHRPISENYTRREPGKRSGYSDWLLAGIQRDGNLSPGSVKNLHVV